MITEKFKSEKQRILEELRSLPGVVGVGIGNKISGGKNTGTIAVQVYVKSKASESDLGADKTIPKTIKMSDGTTIVTDVTATGDVQFSGFTGSYRPAKPGAVIGLSGGPFSGTIGAVVTDNTDGKKAILSCNHVLANWNAAPLGSKILQPGNAFGGTDPADVIGTLKRFVPVDFTPGADNYIDGALCKPTKQRDVRKRSLCSSVKHAKQGAIGMLFAASDQITIINPMSTVLSLLNCSVPKTADATVGMSIHACGAISGYMTTNVHSIHTDLLLNGPQGDVWFRDQVVTAGGVGDGFAGDSGAVWYTTFNV